MENTTDTPTVIDGIELSPELQEQLEAEQQSIEISDVSSPEPQTSKDIYELYASLKDDHKKLQSKYEKLRNEKNIAKQELRDVKTKMNRLVRSNKYYSKLVRIRDIVSNIDKHIYDEVNQEDE